MDDTVIETRNLTVFYGKRRGIIDVNLLVERGEVFGFLGPNGAGKTTTQRVLLDVIHPSGGRASIFGLDSQKDGYRIRRLVGYLPGEFSPYLNMKGQDFLDLLASLQGERVESTYRRQLYDRLNRDPSRKMKQYSHGNKQKIGVVAASARYLRPGECNREWPRWEAGDARSSARAGYCDGKGRSLRY